MQVRSLSYLGLNVADLGSWQRFATEVLGMQSGATGPRGEQILRLDEQAARIVLQSSPDNDIGFVGFDVTSEETAAAHAKSLSAAGAKVRPLKSDEAALRACEGGFVFEDPDGLRLEIAYGMKNAMEPFHSKFDAEFVTGDQGLGHIVVSVSDLERSLDFYKTLGFRISDFIETNLGPDIRVKLAFLHCNPRHHTLALLPLPTPKRLNHLMVQVTSIDAVLAGYYRAQSEGHHIVRHMGRHTNDKMLSFYTDTPAGFHVEFGCDAEVIGENWEVKNYDAISIWGHEGR
jgi:biphenyl-2,3-diol 1,2-dioxygenase